MSKKDVTYLQVKSIADKIVLTGDRPTIQRVYDLLGVVATRDQIAHYLRQWRDEHKDDKPDISETMTQAEVEKLIQARTGELKQSLSLVRSTLESTADGIILVDNDGKLIDFNKKFVEIAKLPKDALEKGEEDVALGSIISLFENPQEILELIVRLKNHPEMQGDMGEVKFTDGRIIERYSQPHKLGSEIVGRVWSFRDVTKKRQAEEALRLRQRAITASSHGVVIFENNEDSNVTYVNPAFKKITGLKENEILNNSFYTLQGSKKNEAEWEGLKLAIREKKEGRAILHDRDKKGNFYWIKMNISPVPDLEKEVTHFVAIMIDITEQKALEKQLMYQATHDSLTDLPNRLLLEDRIRQAILYASRQKRFSAILFLDLDRFKLINDSLGHRIGDEVIKTIAHRLRELLRKTDTVAQIGGDEFIIMLTQLGESIEVEGICKQILEAIRKPVKIAGNEFNITASIGISLFPQDGDNAHALIRNADTAMYYAKDAGRDTYQRYHQQMNKNVSKMLMIENDLRKALDGNEFELNYQPVIDLKTNRVIGVEALLRWNHPDLGRIAPTEFIYIAEETGLIVPIGEWVMEEACRQNCEWLKLGLPPITMSVNVSGRQMKKDKLIATVNNALEHSGMASNLLVLELTENILMDCGEETTDILNGLKDLGVSLAIDDFGTGYSSLSYLKRFPIDKIKIDRVFVRNIVTDMDNQTIVTAIIAMVKKLGLKVLAEGAETKAEMEFLINVDCDEMQGYYFSKPLAAKDATTLLIENHGLFEKT